VSFLIRIGLGSPEVTSEIRRERGREREWGRQEEREREREISIHLIY
jgi:hypothetical protein